MRRIVDVCLPPPPWMKDIEDWYIPGTRDNNYQGTDQVPIDYQRLPDCRQQPSEAPKALNLIRFLSAHYR